MLNQRIEELEQELAATRAAQIFEQTRERLLDIFEKLMYPIPPIEHCAVDWYAGCTATRNKLYGEIRALQPEAPEKDEKA